MIAAVLFLLVMIVLLGWPSSVFLWHRVRAVPLTILQQCLMVACFTAAALIAVGTWWLSMRSGVRALQEMDRTPT